MDQKPYLAKVDGSAQKSRGRPPRHFWGPLMAILDYAGVAGDDRVPLAAISLDIMKHLLLMIILERIISNHKGYFILPFNSQE